MQLIMIDIPDPVDLVLANRQPPRGEDVHLPTSEAARVSLDVSHKSGDTKPHFTGSQERQTSIVSIQYQAHTNGQ